MFDILKGLEETDNANEMLVSYYNGIQNIDLANTIELLDLLRKDIRLYYGVFVDFFFWYGIIIDVNTKGYSVYVNENNKEYNSPARDFLFDEINGDYYIAHSYITKGNHHIPKDIPLNCVVQYHMYCAITRTMKWLNIETK